MSTANKLTYLNTTKGKIKDSINLTGANIGNNDTFRSYSAKLRDSLVDIINNGTDELYDNFPKVTGTGSEIELNNTYEAPMGIDLKGNTSQDSYSGKNLFNKTDYTTIDTFNNQSPTNVTKTENSISFTSNGSQNYSGVYIGGTNTANYIDNFDSSTSYYISVDITTDTNCNIYFPKADDNNLRSITTGTQRLVYNGTISNIVFYVRGTQAKITIENIMVSTNSDTLYEPYVGGTASPNPDYPQNIEVVTGNNTISVCGKNLLNNTSSSDTKNGVTFTKYSDGTVLVNGTATNGTFFNVINDNELPISSTGLIMSGCPSGGAYGTYKLRTTYTDDGFSQDYGEGRELTEGKTIKVITIVISSGTVCNNLLFKPMISTTGGDYEPYVGGTASPNPDYPQAINNVTGRQEITICGKNLFDGQIESGGISPQTGQNVTNATRTRSKNYTKVKPNTTYYYSFEVGDNRWIIGYDKNKNVISDGPEGNYGTGIKRFINYESGTFTTTPTTEYIRWYDTNSTKLDEKVQIEKGSQATTYEPYIGNTYEINLGKNLFDKDNANVINAYFNTTTPTITSGIYARIIYVKCKPNTTYTISKTNSARFYVGCTNVTPTAGVEVFNIVGSNDRTTPCTLTTGQQAQYLVAFIYHSSYDTLTPEEIMATIQIEENPYATSYSAYKTPIELCKSSNGQFQDSIRLSTGKNLFDIDNLSFENGYYDATGSFIEANTNGIFDYILVKPNTTYTLSHNQNLFNSTINEFDANKTWLKRTTASNTNVNTITTNSNTKYVRLKFNYNNSATITKEMIKSYQPQFEVGSTSTDPEPYGVGKWYIYKEITKTIYNGTEEGWNYSSGKFMINDSTNSLSKKGNTIDIPLIYTNLFTKYSWSDYSNYDKSISFLNYSNWNYNATRIIYNEITSLADFKTWLSNHNLEIQYVLATPTIEEITNTELISQLEAIYNAYSYNNQTNISQENAEQPFILNVSALLREE